MIGSGTRWTGVWLSGLVACTSGPRSEQDFAEGGTGGAATDDGPTTEGASATDGADATGSTGRAAGEDDDTGDTPKLDVSPGGSDDGDPPNACRVGDELDAVGDCTEEAPPESFAPTLEWSFDTDPVTRLPLQALSIPLVGNFTDDDGSGTIDLCDTPDVVLVAGLFVNYGLACSVYVLDGATGAMHVRIPDSEGVSCVGTPAFADIDGDGAPEIVAPTILGGQNGVKAFEHDGTPKWTAPNAGEGATQTFWQGAAVAIHDLDADGDAEIVVGHAVFDHEGELLWEHPNPEQAEGEASTAADLDGDGMLEVITGHAAYRHDGTVIFDLHPTVSAGSFPQVGNLDGDPDPEILLATEEGLVLVSHDGAIELGPVRPTGVPMTNQHTWMRPATIHDFDGDGEAEWAHAAAEVFAVYQGAASVVWQGPVADLSGGSAGTAFDFLGDGIAEAMYADESTLGVYDGQTGASVLSQARCSSTFTDYPVVADVDDDGSAEILVVSTLCMDNAPKKPALQVFGEAESRWVQARRIWNQHAYYVTNVKEDGTLPREPVNNWESFNTFRTNAQIEGGGLCIPPQG
jgi:hypothetical protein